MSEILQFLDSNLVRKKSDKVLLVLYHVPVLDHWLCYTVV